MKCISPLYISVISYKLGERFPVPCGKCPHCKKNRFSGWYFRLKQQEKISESAEFVTLTYNTEHVPITQKGFLTLNKTDLQKYFKRLRKLEKSQKLKYYACGEYGGQRKRPHYHIILFNAEKRNIEKAWSIEGKQIGNVFIGSVQNQSISYVLDYMNKEKIIPMFENDDRQKEFSLMSKYLGANFLTENIIKYYQSDYENRNYLPLNGFKLPMPRYYKNKIFTEQQRKKLAEKAMELEYQQHLKLFQEHGDNINNYLAEIHLDKFRKYKIKSEKRWNKELNL